MPKFSLQTTPRNNVMIARTTEAHVMRPKKNHSTNVHLKEGAANMLDQPTV